MPCPTGESHAENMQFAPRLLIGIRFWNLIHHMKKNWILLSALLLLVNCWSERRVCEEFHGGLEEAQIECALLLQLAQQCEARNARGEMDPATGKPVSCSNSSLLFCAIALQGRQDCSKKSKVPLYPKVVRAYAPEFWTQLSLSAFHSNARRNCIVSARFSSLPLAAMFDLVEHSTRSGQEELASNV